MLSINFGFSHYFSGGSKAYCSCFQALSHLTNGLWLTILRNEIMVVDDDVKAVMPILLQMA
ncbi:MAG: hypothetical protein AAF934_12720, partial [Bacteroidota bacterium]